MNKLSLFVAAIALVCAGLQGQRLLRRDNPVGTAPPRIAADKARHCRLDLPGCVPARIEYIYLLHIPKAAGSSVHHFLYSNSPSQNSIYKYRDCKMAENGFLEYHCPARRSWTRNRSENERICSGQQQALHSLSSSGINPFSKMQCSTIVGHYDMQLYDALPQSVRERTLVVTSMRDPADLIVSLFHFLPKAHRFCTNHESCSLLFEHGTVNMTLSSFATGEAGLGIDVAGGATKMLAGDYCCYNQGPPLMTPELRLDAALRALDTKIGVVILQSRVPDSLKYLANVLGWNSPTTDFNINVNPHQRELPQKVRVELEALAGTDMDLYRESVRRAEEQFNIMNAPGVAV